LSKEENNKCVVHSSKLWYWKKEDQEKVVHYPETTEIGIITEGVIPKVHTKVGAEVYKYILASPDKLGDLLKKPNAMNSVSAYYHSAALYWIKAYDFIPYFRRGNTTISTKLKEVSFSSEVDKSIFLLLLNSSIFYFYWIANSNQFDVQMNQIKNFGLRGYDEFLKKGNEIDRLVSLLMSDYKKNSEIITSNRGGGSAEHQQFYPRKSIEIINEIDDFIAPIYGLSDEQNRFLKEYDLSWRTDEEKEE